MLQIMLAKIFSALKRKGMEEQALKIARASDEDVLMRVAEVFVELLETNAPILEGKEAEEFTAGIDNIISALEDLKCEVE